MIKFNNALVTASVLAFGLLVVPAAAESHAENKSTMQNNGNMDHSNMNHSNMDHSKMSASNASKNSSTDSQTIPLEPGQGAFATIAEIVVLLTNDPATDWSKVNIDALREHLIDMDEVALRAKSKTTMHADKIVFTVTGGERTKQAIQAMVPAHAAVLARTTAWDAKGELTEKGAKLTITSNKPAVLNVIKALGFYGVMATGAHHQAHHLAMAKGEGHVHAHN